jgi:adenylylsulfate kinase
MGMKKSLNTVWSQGSVNRDRRCALNGHRSAVIWFTGLSGSGKSTLAHAVEERLHRLKYRTFVLDGDNVRHGLCGDLGFSEADRVENIRRIGETAKLFVEAGVIVLSAFISPYRADRLRARQLCGSRDFIEVFCQSSLDVCEARDVKGLYQRARSGEIQNFTGISAPYEAPLHPELVLDTGGGTVDECARQIMHFLQNWGVVLTDRET